MIKSTCTKGLQSTFETDFFTDTFLQGQKDTSTSKRYGQRKTQDDGKVIKELTQCGNINAAPVERD